MSALVGRAAPAAAKGPTAVAVAAPRLAAVAAAGGCTAAAQRLGPAGATRPTALEPAMPRCPSTGSPSSSTRGARGCCASPEEEEEAELLRASHSCRTTSPPPSEPGACAASSPPELDKLLGTSGSWCATGLSACAARVGYVRTLQTLARGPAGLPPGAGPAPVSSRISGLGVFSLRCSVPGLPRIPAPPLGAYGSPAMESVQEPGPVRCGGAAHAPASRRICALGVPGMQGSPRLRGLGEPMLRDPAQPASASSGVGGAATAGAAPKPNPSPPAESPCATATPARLPPPASGNSSAARKLCAARAGPGVPGSGLG